ncbi:MAG TPA: biotin--[acetyl-CoA-carboxylase] ligase [Chthoniobacterales bacterium]|jgi:BirA family biotin operon repressor/biotin-[acetyl-CoA-carboxylase] ligase
MSTLEPRLLRDALGDCFIGREIVVLEDTASTNDSILERAHRGAPEGLVVFAEHQTAGRGQRANRWESAAHKGLWFSILLRPKIDISESARLSTWAATVVAETIDREVGLATVVKPPNDVYIAGKKVAGVLIEMRAQKHAPHLAVIGIGINVNHGVADFSNELRERAVSLSILLGRAIDRSALAVALLRELDRSYRRTFT